MATARGPYQWPIVKVTDGDTIEVKPAWLLEGLRLRVRVLGIDTPEKTPRAQCKKEADLAQQATAFTKEKVSQGKIILFSRIDNDKYGGRYLATVTIDGKDLSKMLITAGLARPYFGDKKKSWCN